MSEREESENINALAFIVIGMWLTLAMCLVL